MELHSDLEPLQALALEYLEENQLYPGYKYACRSGDYTGDDKGYLWFDVTDAGNIYIDGVWMDVELSVDI